MGSCAGGVSVEWATKGVLESLALSGSGDVLDSLRDLLCGELMCLAYRHSCGCQCSTEYPQAPLDDAERETPERSGSGVEFTGVCRQYLSSMMLGRVCGARAPAMLVHTVSLGAGVLRALLERAKLLFSIVDMMSVNGAAFRQVRVACETLTRVFRGLSKRDSKLKPLTHNVNVIIVNMSKQSAKRLETAQIIGHVGKKHTYPHATPEDA
eukprot:scaffold2832_cov119-Isochrysis_galbana.AAC.1